MRGPGREASERWNCDSRRGGEMMVQFTVAGKAYGAIAWIVHLDAPRRRGFHCPARPIGISRWSVSVMDGRELTVLHYLKSSTPQRTLIALAYFVLMFLPFL